MRYKLILTLASALVLCGCSEKKADKVDTQYVKTEVASCATGVNNLTFPGKTKSADDINVSFRVSGPILKVYVKAGDHVRKGQLLAAMDPRDYQTQLKATQAEYESIKADADRVIAMYNEESTTASNYDKARYGLEQITQKLTNHRNQLADTKLYSPIDGYVQEVLHEGGETVSAGMPIISMFGSGTLEVEINVAAFDYANRDRMNTVYCKFDLLPDEIFPLKVSSISAEANSNQLYTVRMRFTGPYDRTKITPGMTTMVYVSFDQDSTSTHISIPSTAVFEADGHSKVFVYDTKSQTVKSRNITVRRLHRDGTAEVSDGITDGETIVVAGVHHITDGQKVTPMPKSSKSNIGGLL
ncbi:MAG: efflux RND transporter periplasmic adaptor subunit [Bacteroidaceae bacterium]|nr:efflux RND transporter periplasmic adaptor subunit [Bacteroidaceae bacterium]